MYDCAALLLFGEKGAVNFGHEQARDRLPQLLAEDTPGLRAIQELRRRNGVQPPPPTIAAAARAVENDVAHRCAAASPGSGDDDGSDDTGRGRDGSWGSAGGSSAAVAMRCAAKRARPPVAMHCQQHVAGAGFKLAPGLSTLPAASSMASAGAGGSSGGREGGADTGSTDSCLSPSSFWKAMEDAPACAFPGSLGLGDPAPMAAALPLPTPLLEPAAPAVGACCAPAAGADGGSAAVHPEPAAWAGLVGAPALFHNGGVPPLDVSAGGPTPLPAACDAPKLPAAKTSMPPPPPLSVQHAVGSAALGVLPTPGAAPTPRALLEAAVKDLTPSAPPTSTFVADFGEAEYDSGAAVACPASGLDMPFPGEAWNANVGW